MKNHPPVKLAAPFEAWALSAVRAQPGFDATIRADAEITIEGRAHPIVVETKRRVDAANAHAIVALALRTPKGRDFILVAEQTSEGARRILEANEIAYLDGHGNASIRFPGVFVRTGSFGANAVIVDRQPAKARLAGKAGLVVQALLLDRHRSWGVADVAIEAGVSVGLAHRVLARLEAASILAADGLGPRKVRHLADPGALLDLWAEEAKEGGVRRTAAFALTRPGTRTAATLSERLDAAGITHAITGIAAAAILAPALTSVPITQVRVGATVSASDVLNAVEARETNEGANLVITQGADDAELRFRRQVQGIWLAADTRIYLDALRDSRRGKEQAQIFREWVLGL